MEYYRHITMVEGITRKGDNDTVITISYTENTETEEREGNSMFCCRRLHGKI